MIYIEFLTLVFLHGLLVVCVFYYYCLFITNYRKVAYDERRPDINPEFFGIYPFDWVGNDVESFNALQGGLLVAPILQKLILNRYPIETLEFADKVAKWPFTRIIPAHFKVRINKTNIQRKPHVGV
jgi:hypothetical protein